MRRFLLFAGENYYPSGGWDDFVDSFETVEEAKNHRKWSGWDWAHIVDAQTGKVVDAR